MNYKGMEIDIAATNVINGAVTILLPDGEIKIIPEQDATLEELDVIQQIKEDVALRPIVVESVNEVIDADIELANAIEAATTLNELKAALLGTGRLAKVKGAYNK